MDELADLASQSDSFSISEAFDDSLHFLLDPWIIDSLVHGLDCDLVVGLSEVVVDVEFEDVSASSVFPTEGLEVSCEALSRSVGSFSFLAGEVVVDEVLCYLFG